MRFLLAASLAVLLVASACSDVDGPAQGTATPTEAASPLAVETAGLAAATPTPVVRVPSNCSGALPPGLARGETKLQQLNIGIDVRTYLVHVPQGFDNTSSAPVVLNFHGLGGFAEQQEALSGFVPVSEAEGFLLVTPQAMGAAAAWNFGQPPGIFPGGPDDVAFVDDLLDALVAGLCVDQSRVYAAGFSNGAFFVSTLACRLSGRIAAFAPVAGVEYPGGGCPAAVSLLAVHGTEDSVVPFEAGSIFRFLAYAGARENVAAWAQTASCSPGTTAQAAGAGRSMETHDCPDGTSIGLLVLYGVGHAWPRDLARQLWAFFDGVTLPAG